MRKHFFLFVLLLFSLTAGAVTDGINAMLLQGPSDYRLSILLDEQPVVTFQDDYLFVTTHMSAIGIPSSFVTKWTYVKDDEATSINNATHFGSLLSFDGKHLGMTHLEPTSVVQVYTADGALVASGTTDSKGNVSLTVPERQGIVYVVKTSTITFKVSKP